MATGFLYLLTGSFEHNNYLGVLIIMAIGSYALLEFLVKNNQHYNSGVDTLLLCAIVICSHVIIFWKTRSDNPIDYLLLAAIAFYLTLRFTDALMGIVAGAYVMLAIVQLLLPLLMQQNYIVFDMMIIALASLLYWGVKKFEIRNTNYLYNKSYEWAGIFLLFAMYCGGNLLLSPFILSPFHLRHLKFMQSGDSFNLGNSWNLLLWIWMFAMPVVLLYLGIKQKNRTNFRMGIITIVLSVLTFKYFFHIMQTSHALMLFGGLLIVLCYWVINYLKNDRNGLTSKDIDKEQGKFMNLENLFIAEQFGVAEPIPEQGPTFGGGHSDGGGASGDI
jgi:hypothetical protein